MNVVGEHCGSSTRTSLWKLETDCQRYYRDYCIKTEATYLWKAALPPAVVRAMMFDLVFQLSFS